MLVRNILVLVSFLGFLSIPVSSGAQERSSGFRFGFGWHDLGGDVGAAFGSAVDAEFSILVPVSVLRVGAGANWASFDVSGEETSWSQIRFHALVGVPFRLSDRVQRLSTPS